MKNVSERNILCHLTSFASFYPPPASLVCLNHQCKRRKKDGQWHKDEPISNTTLWLLNLHALPRANACATSGWHLYNITYRLLYREARKTQPAKSNTWVNSEPPSSSAWLWWWSWLWSLFPVHFPEFSLLSSSSSLTFSFPEWVTAGERWLTWETKSLTQGDGSREWERWSNWKQTRIFLFRGSAESLICLRHVRFQTIINARNVWSTSNFADRLIWSRIRMSSKMGAIGQATGHFDDQWSVSLVSVRGTAKRAPEGSEDT